MIITCPNCATRYQVPGASFNETGRKVRCQSCRFIWHAVPDAAPSEPPVPDMETGDVETQFESEIVDEVDGADEAEIEIDAIGADIESAASDGADDQPAREGKPERPADWKGWLALAACLTLIVGGFYEYRQAIVSAWPAAARAYALVGLPVNALGIEFANIRVERDFDNGLPVLTIAGEVVNVTSQTVQVPQLRVALRDRTEREIYRWTVSITSDPLKADARARFATRLAAPPKEARAVFLRFDLSGKRKIGLLK